MSTGTPRPQATSTPLRFRRNAARLTAGQVKHLRDAFRAAQGIDDDRGYGYHAGIHGLPLPIGCDNAHGTDYFLPWHRAYLYFFERALRDQVPDAMLTWWDWRVGARRAPRPPPPLAPQPAARPAPPPPRAPKSASRSPPGRPGAAAAPLALQQGGNQVPAKTGREPGAP